VIINLSSGVPRGLLCVFEFLLSNCRVVGRNVVFFVWGFNKGADVRMSDVGWEIFGIFALMVHFGAHLTAF